MNEPLTNSSNRINSSGKTNSHIPNRNSPPSHTTKEQKKVPLSIPDDSFERLPLKTGKAAETQLERKAAPGTVVLGNEEPVLIVDRINASFLGETEGVIEINGESMYPTYPNGCRIAIARLNDTRMLDWGRCYYIIDKNWQGMLKRVQPSDPGQLNSIKLVSDHPDQSKFPSFHRSWDQIEAIFKILAFIVKI